MNNCGCGRERERERNEYEFNGASSGSNFFPSSSLKIIERESDQKKKDPNSKILVESLI